MIDILFGLKLDNYNPEPGHTYDRLLFGPAGLLQFLEVQLGLAVPSQDNEHLRLGAYLSALTAHLEENPEAFFATSFHTDRTGTATDLLSARESLVDAGWKAEIPDDCPARISALAQVETHYQRALQNLDWPAPGRADRLARVFEAIPEIPPLPIRLHHLEPRNLMPVAWGRLLDQLEENGVEVLSLPAPKAEARENSDLWLFQQLLQGQKLPEDAQLKGDGSLLLLRGKNEAGLARVLAAVMRRNPAFRPDLLLGGGAQVFELNVIGESMPALGLSTASLARPALQLLKLLPAFIWDPVNPEKLLEFVSLPDNPLPRALADRIGDLLSRQPGLGGPEWERSIRQYFGQLSSAAPATLAEARKAYRLWFERKRYSGLQPAPVEQILPLLEHLQEWARERHSLQGQTYSWMALYNQSRQLNE